MNRLAALEICDEILALSKRVDATLCEAIAIQQRRIDGDGMRVDDVQPETATPGSDDLADFDCTPEVLPPIAPCSITGDPS